MGAQPEQEIATVEELVGLVGQPSARARDKGRSSLVDVDRSFLAASPFCVVSTSAADGSCDASPKGDPAGHLVHVVDDHTLALAERPGNRRVDGYRNVLTNPHVGLLFLVPGRGDTLRVNGRARLLRDAPYFDAMVVQGHRPVLVLEVRVEEVFFHCSKAFLRSELWDAESWRPDGVDGSLPRRALIAAQVERDDRSLAELDAYYDPANYRRGMYA